MSGRKNDLARARFDTALAGANERVRAFRAAHAGPAKSEALASVEAAARGSENFVPRILEAVKKGATVGEGSDVLRGLWGEHRESLTI